MNSTYPKWQALWDTQYEKMTYDMNWQMTNDNSINSKCKFTKPKFRSNWGKICFSHTWTKTIQKIKVGDQSTFIQVKIDPCEEIKFFHQFKRMSKLSEKAFMFSSAHRQRLSIRTTDNKKPSLSHYYSSSVTKEEWRQTVTDSDRQTQGNCQSNRQTKRVKLKWLREKENKILPTVNSDRIELRKRDGVGREGVEREWEKETRTWLLSG